MPAQSCLILCNSMDCSPPGSSVHGILQARTLEWVAITSSRGSSQPKIKPTSPMSPVLASRFFTTSPPGKPQTASRHMKRCSTLLIIKEMQIKTPMSYHLTLIRMSMIKKSTNKHWRDYRDKGTLLQCCWECKLVQPLWKTVWRYCRKLKIELSYALSIPSLNMYYINYNSKRYMHPYVHSSTIHNSQVMETTWMSIDRWMDKEDAVHIYNGVLLGHKNNEIMPLAATWMQLEMIILSEVRNKKDKYHIISLICGI